MIIIGVILIVLVMILLLAVLCLIGLVSTAINQLRIVAGALSMIATALDERDPTDETDRLLFKNLRQAIYNGIVDGAFQSRQ